MKSRRHQAPSSGVSDRPTKPDLPVLLEEARGSTTTHALTPAKVAGTDPNAPVHVIPDDVGMPPLEKARARTAIILLSDRHPGSCITANDARNGDGDDFEIDLKEDVEGSDKVIPMDAIPVAVEDDYTFTPSNPGSTEVDPNEWHDAVRTNLTPRTATGAHTDPFRAIGKEWDVVPEVLDDSEREPNTTPFKRPGADDTERYVTPTLLKNPESFAVLIATNVVDEFIEDFGNQFTTDKIRIFKTGHVFSEEIISKEEFIEALKKALEGEMKCQKNSDKSFIELSININLKAGIHELLLERYEKFAKARVKEIYLAAIRRLEASV